MDGRNRARELLREFGRDESCNRLCRWVHTVERRCLIEIAIAKRCDRF